jgi:spoIIIJ-associated protein
MSKQQFEGRSAAEAAIKACEALGVTRSELKYSVVSETGEGLARKVAIEVEASPRPAAPAPARHEAEESPDDNRGNSAYGADMGASRPERAGRGGRGRSERRPGSEGHEASGQRGRGGRGGRGGEQADRGNWKRAEGNGNESGNARAASERSEQPERTERTERPERPRRGERDQGRRRSGEGRPPRQREHQERGHQEGIDSLLTIKAAQPGDARHPAIEATSPRSGRALTVVGKLLQFMGMQADAVLVSENEAEVHVHLYGADEGRIIGKKGEVLLALQFILNRILSRQEDEGEQVVVLDAGGYRERRQKALEELAKTLAERSVQERKAVRLSPMSAHDRRIFHMVLKDIDTVGTRSEGDGLYRHLLIIPAEFC